jgi:hypothetical protein
MVCARAMRDLCEGRGRTPVARKSESRSKGSVTDKFTDLRSSHVFAANLSHCRRPVLLSTGVLLIYSIERWKFRASAIPYYASNELQAAAHLQQSPIRPTYTPEAYCYTILRRVLHRPKGEKRSPGLQPLERIRNEIALKGRPVRHEALIIAQVKVLHC